MFWGVYEDWWLVIFCYREMGISLRLVFIVLIFVKIIIEICYICLGIKFFEKFLIFFI